MNINYGFQQDSKAVFRNYVELYGNANSILLLTILYFIIKQQLEA
jgi:hypothetical protein